MYFHLLFFMIIVLEIYFQFLIQNDEWEARGDTVGIFTNKRIVRLRRGEEDKCSFLLT